MIQLRTMCETNYRAKGMSSGVSKTTNHDVLCDERGAPHLLSVYTLGEEDMANRKP